LIYYFYKIIDLIGQLEIKNQVRNLSEEMIGFSIYILKTPFFKGIYGSKKY
jgi:hypothetical protein